MRLEGARRDDKAARHAKTQLRNAIEVMRLAADEIGKCCLLERNYVAVALQRRRGSAGGRRHEIGRASCRERVEISGVAGCRKKRRGVREGGRWRTRIPWKL